VRLSQRDRKELTSGHHHTLHPIQPAALVAWIAKRHDAEISGRKLVAHAVFVASQVAELQGTIALVLDPHDGEVSRVWRERYGFRPAVAEEGKPTRPAVAAASRLDGLTHRAPETAIAQRARPVGASVPSEESGRPSSVRIARFSRWRPCRVSRSATTS
jgi:hypothetical protein